MIINTIIAALAGAFAVVALLWWALHAVEQYDVVRSGAW